MPGVLLIEAMAQTAGWLVIGVTKFTRMPFFAALKEAKLRSFVTPGQALSLSAKLLHEGSGYRGRPRPTSAATASSPATPRSPSGWSSSRTPNSAPTWKRWPTILEFPMGALAHG